MLSFPEAHAFFGHIYLGLFLSDTSFQGKKIFTCVYDYYDYRVVVPEAWLWAVAQYRVQQRAWSLIRCTALNAGGCARRVDLCSSPSTLHNVSWPNLAVEDMGWIQVCRKMKSDPGRIPEREDADSVTRRAHKWFTKCETLEMCWFM